MNTMVLSSVFRNCSIVDAKSGEIFIGRGGDTFIIGRTVSSVTVALMIDGDFGRNGPFYFARLDSWSRRGIAIHDIQVSVAIESQISSEHAPPGALFIDGEMTYVLGFSGQSYQPVAVFGQGGSPSNATVAFTKWALSTEGADGNPVRLFSFEGEATS